MEEESATPVEEESATSVEEVSPTRSRRRARRRSRRRAWSPAIEGTTKLASKDVRHVELVGPNDLEVVVVRRDGFEPSRKTTTTARDACEAYHRER